MASDFQSSFIPKGPVTTDGAKKSSLSIIGILGVLLFVLALLGAGGIEAYKYMLKSDISALQTELANAESGIDKATINQMSDFSDRMDVVKSIVLKHRVVSRFLDTLSTSTVKTVRFSNLSFGSLTPDSLSVKLQGETNSYSSIALQEKIFSDIKYFKSMKFSNLGLQDAGKVMFDLDIVVDPAIAQYEPPASFLTATSTGSVDDLANELDTLDNLDVNLDNI